MPDDIAARTTLGANGLMKRAIGHDCKAPARVCPALLPPTIRPAASCGFLMIASRMYLLCFSVTVGVCHASDSPFARLSFWDIVPSLKNAKVINHSNLRSGTEEVFSQAPVVGVGDSIGSLSDHIKKLKKFHGLFKSEHKDIYIRA